MEKRVQQRNLRVKQNLKSYGDKWRNLKTNWNKCERQWRKNLLKRRRTLKWEWGMSKMRSLKVKTSLLQFLQRKKTSFGTNFVIWGDQRTTENFWLCAKTRRNLVRIVWERKSCDLRNIAAGESLFEQSRGRRMWIEVVFGASSSAAEHWSPQRRSW